MQPTAPITDFPTRMINDWIFDLDNTIYPARTKLFLRVAVRITEFVANHYLVPHDEARVIQKDLFHRYGTTMRGMMTEEAICPDTYLKFVHDIIKAHGKQKKKFVVGNNGNDENNGKQPGSPWKTVKKINSIIFEPGDNIYFKRGTSYSHGLQINGNGTKDNPITVSAYGEEMLRSLQIPMTVYSMGMQFK